MSEHAGASLPRYRTWTGARSRAARRRLGDCSTTCGALGRRSAAKAGSSEGTNHSAGCGSAAATIRERPALGAVRCAQEQRRGRTSPVCKALTRSAPSCLRRRSSSPPPPRASTRGPRSPTTKPPWAAARPDALLGRERAVPRQTRKRLPPGHHPQLVGELPGVGSAQRGGAERRAKGECHLKGHHDRTTAGDQGRDASAADARWLRGCPSVAVLRRASFGCAA